MTLIQVLFDSKHLLKLEVMISFLFYYIFLSDN